MYYHSMMYNRSFHLFLDCIDQNYIANHLIKYHDGIRAKTEIKGRILSRFWLLDLKIFKIRHVLLTILPLKYHLRNMFYTCCLLLASHFNVIDFFIVSSLNSFTSFVHSKTFLFYVSDTFTVSILLLIWYQYNKTAGWNWLKNDSWSCPSEIHLAQMSIADAPGWWGITWAE